MSKLAFETKDAAMDYLISCGLNQSASDNWFIQKGEYCLSHGEYSRPVFSARKYGKVWGIHREVHYYSGTLNCPSSGRIDADYFD